MSVHQTSIPGVAGAPRSSHDNRHSPQTDRVVRLLGQLQELLDAGQTEQALQRIRTAESSSDPRLKNALGVCLLRKCEHEKAVTLFRALVLVPGGIMLRNDVPVCWKTNLATALLMSGRASGCVSVLNEIGTDPHPAIARLTAAISSWKKSLSLLQKLSWKLGLDPDRAVQLDFPPGDLN
ncbi:MAG: tetratricopeptide repeat protein [Planctomycetaceae bacterium]|nr:tetratricopeptide repeat protein [Planctomycetaceae bacterium]